jgi:uncharacterized iron-regulated protein
MTLKVKLALVLVTALSAMTDSPSAASNCVPIGGWFAPGTSSSQKLTASAAISQLASRSVVLLGESHDNAEHHRWQLQTLAALHALRPEMVIGFEMFPRSVQGALDRWVAGETSETEFLRDSRWSKVWSIDAQLYTPLFHFARMNRVPMLALNVERELVTEVREKGYDGIPEEKREGVTRPAPPSAGYIDMLFDVYREHARAGHAQSPTRDDPAFRRFVEAQQIWDRAMAEALATALRRMPGALVVAVMGSGHIVHGYGVPHQLRELGIASVGVALPWDQSEDCGRLAGGMADLVFGVAAATKSATRRQRLGVVLDAADRGIRIREVEQGSIAEVAGIRAGDIVIEAAGVPVGEPADLAGAVQRHAPGTWLPLKVKRGDAVLELLAKFPPLGT